MSEEQQVQRLNYTEMAPAGIAAMRGVEHYLNTGTLLEPVLLELVRLRASLLNGCEYCIGLHTHELTKHNETPGRIGGVADWQQSAAYTQRERAALAWTEAVTNVQEGHVPEAAFAAVCTHFSHAEVVNLTIAIASINAWNRLAISFRAQRRASLKPEVSPIADDGGKITVDDE